MTFIQTELVHGLIHLTDTFMTIRLVDRIFRKQRSKWHRAEFCFGIFLLVLLKTRTGFESQTSSIEKVIIFTHSAKPQKYHQRIYSVNTLKVVVIILWGIHFEAKINAGSFIKLHVVKHLTKLHQFLYKPLFIQLQVVGSIYLLFKNMLSG